MYVFRSLKERKKEKKERKKENEKIDVVPLFNPLLKLTTRTQ